MTGHLNSLLAITQLLASKPTLDDLCNFLSLRHCPSGEVSRVYVGKILGESNLRVEAVQGFEPENCFIGKVFPLEIGRPSGKAILENKIIIEINRPEYYLKYPAIKNVPIPYPWSSQVTIPINDQYFMQLGRYAPISEGDELFYQNLQSLMQLYFNRIGKVSLEVGDLFGKLLTTRQEMILQLMRSKFTNEAIAQKIGYSPSLVKQETMLIFSKLGISGRKELTNAS
ncbi:MAG: DNA-binding response regulator [Actinobacteria bacterium]|nr:DNA-binding response regulator [Actinomycetota bacterium]